MKKYIESKYIESKYIESKYKDYKNKEFEKFLKESREMRIQLECRK